MYSYNSFCPGNFNMRSRECIWEDNPQTELAEIIARAFCRTPEERIPYCDEVASLFPRPTTYGCSWGCGCGCGCGCHCPFDGGNNLRGFQAQLTGGTTLTNAAVVPFNIVVNDQSKFIGYTPSSGNIIISKPGNYLVNWSVNLQLAAAQRVAFALRLDSTDVDVQDAYLARGQMSGTSLITVKNTPATLSLVNMSGSAITFDGTTNVDANIVITEAR